jgi:hypothetical protein
VFTDAGPFREAAVSKEECERLSKEYARVVQDRERQRIDHEVELMRVRTIIRNPKIHDSLKVRKGHEGYQCPHLDHPTPYTLHPTPYTLHPTPYTLHPTPYTLYPVP